jgi:hypothetical protein
MMRGAVKSDTGINLESDEQNALLRQAELDN